ncbi:MAG: GDP-mannose 4,6-dehydratase [bacterium]|nr:GDP-mannose 4,6-dehydratase [bacterium]
MKKALITGITGQDGSYLAELLLDKNYQVHGLVRRSAVEKKDERFSRIKHILNRIEMHYGDVRDYPAIWRLIEKIKPDELYHLAAQSQVGVSFEDDFGTFQINTNGTHYLLDAVKNIKPDCKFYFAGTSEMFGDVKESPQNEDSLFNPVSPYGISKLASFYLTKMYRDAYGVFACTGILFNHESPRRGFEFVTRKITSTAAKIKFNLEDRLELGNLSAKRDWGFAGDYVRAMWLMLQQDKPEDFVIGTGENHSVREFVELAFKGIGIDIEWKGEGINERGANKNTGRDLIFVKEEYFRPLDVNKLLADASKAKEKLNWKPEKKFKDLVGLMIKSDLESIE